MSDARDTGSRALGRNGKAMIGNYLLEYRLMKAHQEQLLEEGQRGQRVHFAAITRPSPVRSAAARFGSRLEAVGRRLQALDQGAATRH